MKEPTGPHSDNPRPWPWRRANRCAALSGVCFLAVAASVYVGSAAAYKVDKPEAGGVLPHPVITSVTKAQDVTVNWQGFGGPYTIEKSSGLVPGNWQPFGGPVDGTSLTLPAEGAMGFLRVKGGGSYVGALRCSGCHPAAHAAWSATAHQGALETLKAIGQGANATCMPCHTVGYGFPNGYKDEASTPGLTGVQCENCHGPGGEHAADSSNLDKRPVKSYAAEVCGGCHTGFHHPTYDEWKGAGHAKVTPDVVGSLLTGGSARALACGPCHSGATRLTLLNNVDVPAASQKPVATGQDAASTGITCAVCHDPHVKTANGRQLRNPTKSTGSYSYSTSTNTTFEAQYKPATEINICGQCHNARGASYKDTSRPPHHSPQYPMLTGQGGWDLGVTKTHPHMDSLKQCAGCHTHRHDPATPTEETPVYTGHGFEPRLEACVECHGDAETAQGKLESTQADIVKRLGDVKALLDKWATNKADVTIRDKYGALAWEYNNAGIFGNPTGSSTVKGPTSAEQTVVPDAIKQARMNLYLIQHDASKGVHNANYARYLLRVATTNINTELAKP